jgi:heme exporter protein B
MGPAAEVTAQPGRPSWGAQVLTVLRKDLAIEARSGEVVVTSGFFAVLVVVLASLSFYQGRAGSQHLAGGVIWLSVAFAAVLSLGKTWQREREESALDGLLIAPLSRSAIFAGKAFGVLLFLFAIELVVIPLAALFFALDVSKVWLGLLLIALATTPGVAASGTLFGSMTVRTQARDLLLATVLFPLLAPTLLAAVAGTRALLDGAPLGELVDYLKLMLVFDVVFISGGLVMFENLIER